MVLYFYTKQQCPLCEKGLAVIKEVRGRIDFQIEERNIYSNDEWLENYQIRIPVVETNDGKVLGEGIISADALELNLRSYLKYADTATKRS